MSNFRYTPEMSADERIALRRIVTKEVPPGLLAEQYLQWRERAEKAEAGTDALLGRIERLTKELGLSLPGE